MNAPESIKEIEAASQEIAREFVLGNLIKAASKRFKSLAVPYMELKQHEQTKLLEEIEKDCRDAVNNAIDLIASNQRLTFRAAVDQVVFKDGVKAVLTMGKTEEGRALHRMNDSAWRSARKRAAVLWSKEYGNPNPGFSCVRIHDLKHTFGRRLRAANISHEDRQALLGHKSGNVTTHYSGAELAALIAAANKITQTENSTPVLTILRRKSA